MTDWGFCGIMADKEAWKEVANLTAKEMAKYIDHTLLKQDATRAQVKKVCDEAKAYGFASVCVNPCYVKYVSEQLAGEDVAACCVIGFPLGATSPAMKASECALAVADGAQEVDMVVNVGAIKSGEWDAVREDIAKVVEQKGAAKLKVIIETCLLTDEEKVKVCEIAKEVHADFVKTSTGFSSGGATAHDVALMRATVGDALGVKASGGIRTLEDTLKMIEAGASRIGASAGVKIVEALA